MTLGRMDLRDPNGFDLIDLGDQIQAIHNAYRPTHIKIFETEVNMEAPDADAERASGITNTFSGAARQVDQVVCGADVGKSLNSTAFYFCVTTTQHYVWLDVDNTGSDPSLTGTAHEVDISENDTAATVAGAIKLVIDAIANITCTVSTATLIISNDNVGVNTIAATDEDTGFTFTNIITGTAAYTANYFYAVSSDAKDTAAGVGVRTIRVAILDANGVPTTTDISMAGATNVKSSVTALAILGMWALTAGTEKDAAGNITLLDYKATDVYATIAAASNCTVSCRAPVHTGWNLKIGDVRAYIVEANDAAVDIDPELGAVLTPLVDNEASGLDDDIVDVWTVTHYQPFYRKDIHRIVDGYNAAQYTLNHVTKADDKNTTIYTRIRYIYWSDAA